MGASCGKCSVVSENPADPDIVGFGVLLGFIFPVLASHVFVVLAYVASTVNRHQHTQLDETIYPRIRSVTSTWKLLQRFQYQRIILPLGDQLLITSIGLAVAIFSQICTMSVYSFDVSSVLVGLGSGVHIDCIITMGSYFDNHPRQARLRIGSMILLLVFLSVTDLLVHVMANNDWDEFADCAMHHSVMGTVEMRWRLAAWVSYCYWVSSGHYDAVVFLRDSKHEFRPAYTSVLHFARLFYRSPQRKKEFRALERAERKRVRERYMRRRDELRRSNSLWKRWRIALPALVDDTSQSVIWFFFSNLTLTLYHLVILIRFLAGGYVNVSPLFEPKFGQIMPLFLPLVFIFSVFEATSNEKPQESTPELGNNNQALSPGIELEETHSAVPASENARQGSSETLREHPSTGNTEGKEPALVGVVRRVMKRNREPPPPPPPSVVSQSSMELDNAVPSTANASICEASDDESSGGEDPGTSEKVKARMLLARAVHEEEPTLTVAFVCLAFMGQILYIVVVLHYYTETVLTYFGVSVLLNLLQTGIGLGWFWKARQEMRSKRLARRTGTGNLEMAAATGAG